MHSSGFLRFPSEHTLRDYTNYFTNQPGFQPDLNEQLAKEADVKSLAENKKYVALLDDKMKIKEDLVYNKTTGKIIGFTSLGNISDILLEMEVKCQDNHVQHPPVAKYILVLMVRGIFVKLNFPYAHFATCGITGDVLFPIIWEAICQLEIIGLKVICITGDGASHNRKFFRMHNTGLVYKTPNLSSKEKRFVYFISDPPHLVKTVCNCWSHSGYNGTRLMTVSCTTVCVITMNVILL